MSSSSRILSSLQLACVGQGSSEKLPIVEKWLLLNTILFQMQLVHKLLSGLDSAGMWHISNAIGCYSDKLGLSHKVVKRLFLNLMYLFSLFFRENVLSNLSDKAFNRPICEALLNQKYFNGIGNYLRAEILYRLFLTLLLTVVSIQICILNTEFLPIEKALPFHSLDAELEYCMPVLSLFPPP